MPVIARVGETGEDHLVSGRHRTGAIAHICTKYGVTAAGKIVELGRVDATGAVIPDPEHSTISPEVKVLRIVVPDMVALSALQQTFNGSRSMTDAEKILVEAAATGKLSPAKQAKMSLVTLFQSKGLFSTFQISLAVATSIATALGDTAKYLDKQLGETENPYSSSLKVKLEWDTDKTACEYIVNEFAEYMATFPDNVPSNMGLHYKQLVSSVLLQEVELEDENGDEYVAPLLHDIATQFHQPEKAVKSAGKVAQLQEELAQLRALLAASSAK
jgi:hypothetical protein